MEGEGPREDMWDSTCRGGGGCKRKGERKERREEKVLWGGGEETLDCVFTARAASIAYFGGEGGLFSVFDC